MKILYGVCGEGFGHSSRAKRIIPFLIKKGHEVKVISYGQGYSELKREGFDVINAPGLRMVFEKGRIKKRKTIVENIREFFMYRKFTNLKKKIERFKPELCISDMESLVPLVSNLYKLPLVSIDNQHRITKMKFKIPKKYKRDYLLAKVVVNSILRRAEAFIVLSFVKEKVKDENVYLVDPLLREEVLKLKPKKGKKILVYESRKVGGLLEILKDINEKFVVYGYQIEKKEGNLEFKKFGESFLKDLAECKAVIGTAGFSLISEAIYLRKPYFALPLGGQFEQVLNSLLLKKKGFGDFSEVVERKEIDRFLRSLGKYEKNLKKKKMNANEALDVLDKVLRSLD